MKEKIAVMIYPYFSMQEISCLTSALAVWYGKKFDVVASSKQPYETEDGFKIIANKTFDEIDADDYRCLIMPGIINPLPALFDQSNIDFLKRFEGKDVVIAAISSAPMLLAKAGLLDGVTFTSGIWEDIIEYVGFIPAENNLHRPLVKDKNFITAIGFAFREFAVETLRAIGIEIKDNAFAGVDKEYSAEELAFRMDAEDFEYFVKEYGSYADKTAPN